MAAKLALQHGGRAEPMVSRGLFPRQLNPLGTPLACFGDPLFKKSPALRKQQAEPIFESLFTRSSLMLFMLGEILTQALVTINSPATRARREQPNLPRRPAAAHLYRAHGHARGGKTHLPPLGHLGRAGSLAGPGLEPVVRARACGPDRGRLPPKPAGALRLGRSQLLPTGAPL